MPYSHSTSGIISNLTETIMLNPGTNNYINIDITVCWLQMNIWNNYSLLNTSNTLITYKSMLNALRIPHLRINNNIKPDKPSISHPEVGSGGDKMYAYRTSTPKSRVVVFVMYLPIMKK